MTQSLHLHIIHYMGNQICDTMQSTIVAGLLWKIKCSNNLYYHFKENMSNCKKIKATWMDGNDNPTKYMTNTCTHEIRAKCRCHFVEYRSHPVITWNNTQWSRGITPSVFYFFKPLDTTFILDISSITHKLESNDLIELRVNKQRSFNINWWVSVCFQDWLNLNKNTWVFHHSIFLLVIVDL